MKSHFLREVWMMCLCALLLHGCAPAVVVEGDVLPMAVTSAQMVKDYALLKGGDFVLFGPDGLQLFWRPLQTGVAWVVEKGGTVLSSRLSPEVCSGNFCSFQTFNDLTTYLKANGWAAAPAAGAWWQAVGKWFWSGARIVMVAASEVMVVIVFTIYQPVGAPTGPIQ